MTSDPVNVTWSTQHFFGHRVHSLNTNRDFISDKNQDIEIAILREEKSRSLLDTP